MLKNIIGSAFLLPTVCLRNPQRRKPRQKGGEGGTTSKTPRAQRRRAARDLQKDPPLRSPSARTPLFGRRLSAVLAPKANIRTNRKPRRGNDGTSVPPVQALHAVLSLHPRKPTQQRHPTRAKTLRRKRTHPNVLKLSKTSQHEYESVEGGVP